jgi:transcriptional regulator with XRE-family HTH domain
MPENASGPDREVVAFGRTIRAAREARGMTPAEAADAAGLDRDWLEALEAGRLTSPDAPSLEALATGLGMESKALVSTGHSLDTIGSCVAFGRRVRELRKERGLSQAALGELSSLHRTAIDKYERGTTDPRLTTIRRLARGLQVPPGALFEEG